MNTCVVNNMTVSVDWMSFTIMDRSYTVSAVIKFLGFDDTFFHDTGHGAMGYKTLHKMGDYAVSVLSDGRDDMGIHVTVGGSAVAHVLTHFYKSQFCLDNPFDGEKIADCDDVNVDVLHLFVRKVLEIGRFTRIDLALDDHVVHFTPADIREYISSGQMVSRFRSGRREEGFSLSPDALNGDTLYLGSRSSSCMLRIYDKKLEQLCKHPDMEISDPWIRWEFQFGDKRADVVAMEILKHDSIGDLFFEILNNYVRLIVCTETNRSRCPMLPEWAEFTVCVRKLSLYCPPVEKTLDDKRNWIVSQVLPTLTGIIIADGGVLDIITKHWDRSIDRMSPSMIRLVENCLRARQ